MEVIKTFSDAELVQNLRSGNRANDSIAFIYRHHFETLSWFIMNNSGSRQDAEDIFQEVVVNFIEMVRLDKFRGESTVKTILFSMNRNLWLNELKRRGRAGARELNYERGQDRVEADASAQIVEREARAQMMKIMDDLGETCKKILLMFYYENLSMKDILARLDYENEQVVRNKKYKCLKQLEQMIAANPNLKQTLKNLLNG
jgi:RNA polymerase sigma factor (sigma-70 family)